MIDLGIITVKITNNMRIIIESEYLTEQQIQDATEDMRNNGEIIKLIIDASKIVEDTVNTLNSKIEVLTNRTAIEVM